MYPEIKKYCDELVASFDEISDERKVLLEKISNYIKLKKEQKLTVNLVYVCTHNSRRSHFGQVWAAVAANYFGIANVSTFSGGTEATAFNQNAIDALILVGFKVTKVEESKNPLQIVTFGEHLFTACFSKEYNHFTNPSNNFAAIMTCSDAEENCPFIPGVELRIGTTYDDPKAFDNTPKQAEMYKKRSQQIALETLYVFSKV
jgi:protein-tyrosine phosphatase/arsenate reductase